MWIVYYGLHAAPHVVSQQVFVSLCSNGNRQLTLIKSQIRIEDRRNSSGNNSILDAQFLEYDSSDQEGDIPIDNIAGNKKGFTAELIVPIPLASFKDQPDNVQLYHWETEMVDGFFKVSCIGEGILLIPTIIVLPSSFSDPRQSQFRTISNNTQENSPKFRQ